MYEEGKTLVEDMIEGVIKGAKLSKSDHDLVMKRLSDELRKRPFKVAVIGQAGVGKTTTMQAWFGANPSDECPSDIKEGTTNVVTKIYHIADGFDVEINDMPGLGNDFRKDEEYERMYAKVLPTVDVIVYVISAKAKDFGEDCRILHDIVIPICKDNDVLKNLVIGVNQIDTIGENSGIDWDKHTQDGKLSDALYDLIQVKRHHINTKLINEKVVVNGTDAVPTERVAYYSALRAYNMKMVMEAILKTERGWVFVGTIGIDVMNNWIKEHTTDASVKQ